MGILHPRVWVENPNRSKRVHEQEASKQIVLMLKLLKWDEEIVPVGPTFEDVPIGSKPSASSNASKPSTHSRKAYILVVVQCMFKI